MFRLLTLLIGACVVTAPAHADSLPGTKPLTGEGDLAMKMVAGIDKYLMRELAASVEKRSQFWKPDFSSVEAYTKSVQPNRERLKKILGVVDPRVPVTMHYVATTDVPSLVAETELYKVHAVRWTVLDGVDGEGLLLEPKGKVVANVVAIPDADWTPEMIVGLAPGVPKESQFARRLAENGCRVLVPGLIDRQDTWSGSAALKRFTNQPHREFIYRMAYQMGRHVIGYEVQKVLAAVDWFTRDRKHPPVSVYGYGEGGLLALCSAAIDERIDITMVNGHFGPRAQIWQQPIYRSIWALLPTFSDADLARLLMGRSLIVARDSVPAVAGPPPTRPGRSGAAPGRLEPVPQELYDAEILRLSQDAYNRFGEGTKRGVYHHSKSEHQTTQTLGTFFQVLFNGDYVKVGDREPPRSQRKILDPAPRQKRQFDQLVAFTQKLMRDSEQRRAETFWSKLDLKSLDGFQKSAEPFRKQLWEDVLGKLPPPTEPINPRTRQLHDTPKWTSYEVTLDLYPDVFAHGILCVPKGMKPGEKRPVVVCQHGLEGRPTDVVNPKEKTKYYNSFGSALADRGYIVFAPQNPYIGQDKFRVLQRKANPLGLSIFSFIICQHERILDWLASQPFVDPERMAFYGLSYGGKTAMRVPAVLPRYVLSICSGDFNEWTWKNVSVDFRGSYMFTGEYEMPEFNMGHTLVYAEMAALIAPRPFMVERGHDDGVGIDEWVAYEYAKVRRLYAKLGIADRAEIEFFNGGHEINGKGTFAFLDKHLKWTPQ